MKIKAKMTLLLNADGLHLEIMDEASRVHFFEARVDPQSTMELLSRRGLVEVDAEVRGLDKVGKQKESMEVTVRLPKGTKLEERKEVAQALAQEKCPKNWFVDDHLLGRGKFFYDGERFECAHVRISCWIEGGE